MAIEKQPNPWFWTGEPVGNFVHDGFDEQEDAGFAHDEFVWECVDEWVPEIEYKFNEGNLLKELKEYIDSTYSQHYAKGGKIQTNEFVITNGDGVGAMRHSIYKYIQRYGSKDGRNRKDLLKALHYAILLLYVHDYETSKQQTNQEE